MCKLFISAIYNIFIRDKNYGFQWGTLGYLDKIVRNMHIKVVTFTVKSFKFVHSWFYSLYNCLSVQQLEIFYTIFASLCFASKFIQFLSLHSQHCV